MAVNKSYYEKLHSDSKEPWEYNHRAAEQLRHNAILNLTAQFCPKEQPQILDIGCSMGQLTGKLAQRFQNVFALDLSETALKKFSEQWSVISSQEPASEACQSPAGPYGGGCSRRGRSINLVAASSVRLPFQNNCFDAAVLADGLSEWQLDENELKQALSEVHRVLNEGGVALFSDYLNPNRFQSWIETISKGPLKIVQTIYLNDRLWYQFESWFKAIRHWGWAKKILSSLFIAQFLNLLSKCLGPSGSRHILLVARKINHA